MKNILFFFSLFLSSVCGAQETRDFTLPCTIEGYDTFIFEQRGVLYTELGKACFDGDTAKVSKLLSMGCDSEYCAIDDIYGYDLIWIAIDREDTIMVKNLLEKGLDVSALYSDNGVNSLSKACAIKNQEVSLCVVRALLDTGMNANGVGDIGGMYVIYPLIIAIQNNHVEVLKLLLERGARLDIQSGGLTPLDAAKATKNQFLIEFITKKLETH